MRALPALLLLALLAAGQAAAQEAPGVAVRDVAVPERTLAGRTFDLHANFTNEGPARDVFLFVALYEPAEGVECGPSTDPRFRGFTHVVQEKVRLEGHGTTAFPSGFDRWPQRYERADVPAGDATMELCVFVAEAESQREIDYLAYRRVALPTRGENAPPEPSFAWTPREPRAAQDEARFEAQATDADGDALTYRWDFGAEAEPRFAEGPVATHRFWPAGEREVVLTVSDGWDVATAREVVAVRPEGAAPAEPVDLQEQPPRDAPLPWLLTPLAALLAARRLRRS